jgi:hypothetical protein
MTSHGWNQAGDHRRRSIGLVLVSISGLNHPDAIVQLTTVQHEAAATPG